LFLFISSSILIFPLSLHDALPIFNSGAKIWLADFEDASTPAWPNVIDAQLNLYRAARGELSFTNDAGKTYSLRTDGELATVVARSEEHTSELQSRFDLVCRLLLEK